MSSRAIRKLQKLREQQLQQAEPAEDESSEDEPVTRPSKLKLNAFDLLNAGEEEENGAEAEEEPDKDIQDVTPQPSQPVPTAPKSAESKQKKRDKKKKKKAAPKLTTAVESEAPKAGVDEIDRALKDLAVEKSSYDVGDASTTATHTRDSSFPKTPEELLSIDRKSVV